MRLEDLAERLGAELYGDAEVEINGVAGIEEALAGQITFLANAKYAPLVRKTKASAIIIANTDLRHPAGLAVLRSDNPYLAFARAIDLFYQPPVYPPGIHPSAVIHPSAKIGANASIGPYVVIQPGVEIGEDATIHPHVVIYPFVRIGKRFTAHAHAVVREHCALGDDVVLQNGAVVGCDGFGFAKDNAEAWFKITQSGPAVLEDKVEVQANSCIDRASIGETRIGRGSKIDNLVQVGHGSHVGENTLLCAQVGLAGSTMVGNQVILAGQVGAAGHCKIGDGAVATAQSGVRDVPAGKIVSGSPAIDNRQWLRAVFEFNKLPDTMRQLRAAVPSNTEHE